MCTKRIILFLSLVVTSHLTFQSNYCLTAINLSWNGLAYEGSLAVCRLIENNKYLLELDISNNRINWEGAALIAQGLKNNDVLEVLRVCTSIPAAGD